MNRRLKHDGTLNTIPSFNQIQRTALSSSLLHIFSFLFLASFPALFGIFSLPFPSSFSSFLWKILFPCIILSFYFIYPFILGFLLLFQIKAFQFAFPTLPAITVQYTGNGTRTCSVCISLPNCVQGGRRFCLTSLPRDIFIHYIQTVCSTWAIQCANSFILEK